MHFQKITVNHYYMKKLLLSLALVAGFGCAASALSVQDICKKYTYTGEVFDSPVYYGEGAVFPGATASGDNVKIAGETTIVADKDNTVTVKGLFPGAKDMTAVFDPAKLTLTFTVQPGLAFHSDRDNRDYVLNFATGTVANVDGYDVISGIAPVVGTFDANGVLTLSNWAVYEPGYAEPFAYNGKTVYTPADASVGTVEADYAPAVYYNLQGIRVDNPTSGVYVVRQSGKVSKVVL